MCGNSGTDASNNITGNYNTAIGYSAGVLNQGGANNTYLGASTDATGGPFNNSTAVGYNAKITASNQIVLGTATETVYIPSGQTVCQYTATSQNYIYFLGSTQDIANPRGKISSSSATSVTYSTSSDERRKTNIVDMPSQLENIQKLKPRKFQWKEDGSFDDGFIAQEFYSVYPEKNPIINDDTYTNKLYPKNADGSDHMFCMDYGRMTPMLWKGVSELIDITKQQEQLIHKQKSEIADLRSEIAELRSLVKSLINK